MSSQITTKLEINLLDAKTTPQIVSEFAIKYKAQAIVAAPEYIAPLVAHRAIMGGNYRLICALDFPKGANYAMDKLFRSNPDFIGADGFEILLSTGRTEIESKNEMKAIYSFLKANRPLADIRWCLRMHTADAAEVEGILKNMAKFPPSYVRVDPHRETPAATVEKLKQHVKTVGKHVPYPIKLSGNITLEALQELQGERGVKRFDVSMKQAEAIVRLLKIEAQAVTPVSQQPKKKGPAVKKVGNVGRIRL
jgi:hypothetical protein